MGLFKKKDNLAAFEVQESDNVEKFSYNGKFYNLQAYVTARESAVRAAVNNDHVKTVKNYKKAEKAYVKNKDAVTYIEYALGKQLFNGAEKIKISSLDVKNNTN